MHKYIKYHVLGNPHVHSLSKGSLYEQIYVNKYIHTLTTLTLQLQLVTHVHSQTLTQVSVFFPAY